MEEKNLTAPETEYQPVGPTVRIKYIMGFRDLYSFTLRFALTGLNGMAFWLVLALVLWRFATGFATDSTNTRVLLLVAMAFLVILMPGNLCLRTLAQCKLAKMNQLYTEYEVSETGFFIRQGTESELIPWKLIMKTRETKNYVYAYVHKNSAFIFPKRLLGEQLPVLKQLIAEHSTSK